MIKQILPSTIKRIRRLFEDQIGLIPTLIDDLALNRVLIERMAICGIEDANDYYQMAKASAQEFQELIELIVVPETWFFRDKTSIEFIKEKILNTWQSEKNVKILSMPCSSGEEPYSIAMALIGANIPKSHFSIDGIDISKKLIAKAELGLYGRNSFRGKDLSFRDRFFDQTKAGYQIHSSIQKLVDFMAFNLFDSQILLRNVHYHIIFCRNLFIYLHPKAQKKACETLKQLLFPKGVLVVSPAETEIIHQMGFNPLTPLKSCAFILEEKKQSANSEPVENPPIISPPIVEVAQKKGKPEETDQLKKANILADNGEFEEAAKACMEYMKTHETNPEGYFLLGLIRHAVGNEELAEELFLRTVYLKPDHYEALVYLALLAEKKGDKKLASLYRKRAERSAILLKK